VGLVGSALLRVASTDTLHRAIEIFASREAAIMSHQITLNFEDGVTRFIECQDGEMVADASHRARINIPLDCRDGVCGTCKAFCESGEYELGDYVIDAAMTKEEAGEGYVLTCQMTPLTDCVVRIPTASALAQAAVSAHAGRISTINRISETTIGFSIEVDNRGALAFLPGQYVNIQVPGSDQTRSYSFSSGPKADEASFLLRNTPKGALSTYLREQARVGDRIEFHGPLGSFYLRPIQRPALFLAGGTGLAPFLAMLEKISDDGGSDHSIHLIFGVTNDADLVELDKLEAYTKRLRNFTFTCTVADEGSSYSNKGYVTRYIEPAHLNGGDADVYLCGPPPMVDAVRSFLTTENVAPRNFYYEKFSNTGLVVETGEERLKPIDVDEAFDIRMVLELGAAQLTVGRLSSEQLAKFRKLAEATAPLIVGGRFTDLPAFLEANTAFHKFLIESTGNALLISTYQQLAVHEYIARAITPDVEVVGDIIQEHRDLIAAFELGNLASARDIIVAHAQHSKATLSRCLEKVSSATSPGKAATKGPQTAAPTGTPAGDRAAKTLPPYSHELTWPEGLEPFKVVDDGSQGDPYRHYEWMRENAPALRCATPTSDVWFISRYDDVFQAVRSNKVFSSKVVDPPPLTFLTIYDPPDHSRLRKVIQPSFMPNALEPFVEQITDKAAHLLDNLLARGGGDVVDDYAIPLSISTISTMIDVPGEDEDKMKFWSDETFSYFGRLARNAPGTGTDEQSSMEFFAYLKDALQRLYVERSQSIGGHIARMWKDGLLTEKEAKELCAFAFIAGHDTTTILVANAFRMFTEQPNLVARVRQAPDDAERFVEEVARYRGTVQRVSRVTTEEVEVAGVTLPKGAIVRLLLSAANRDSRKFADGETFNIDRDTTGHLGFGNGIHKCLGAPLAKLETLITTKLVAQKVGGIALDPLHPIQYVRGNNLTNSGPEHLFVTMDAHHG
jgi:benzoate/toluate 1,2-dioxygenase reductase component